MNWKLELITGTGGTGGVIRSRVGGSSNTMCLVNMSKDMLSEFDAKEEKRYWVGTKITREKQHDEYWNFEFVYFRIFQILKFQDLEISDYVTFLVTTVLGKVSFELKTTWTAFFLKCFTIFLS